MTYTITSIEVDPAAVRYHCDHRDGVIALTVVDHPTRVYVTGTPAQIVDWAHRVADIASEHIPASVDVTIGAPGTGEDF